MLIMAGKTEDKIPFFPLLHFVIISAIQNLQILFFTSYPLLSIGKCSLHQSKRRNEMTKRNESP